MSARVELRTLGATDLTVSRIGLGGAAHDAGLGVIVKEALANGRLTARGDAPMLRQVYWDERAALRWN